MKFAFFFPGQGSQSVGMMQGFGDQPVVCDTFAQASDVLGQDLWRMVTEPNEELNQTANTQPLMLTAGVAAWRAWQQTGGAQPSVLAGHSLGEYTALVASGALDFAAALPLVRYRAEVMQGAVGEGGGPWQPSSAWTTTQCVRFVPKARRARYWKRSISIRLAR